VSRADRALLVARTVRHLRARQIFGRVRLAVRGHAARRPVDAPWHPARAGRVIGALVALGPVGTPDEVRRAVAAWRGGRLELLGRSEPAPVTWREPAPTPLWAYHVQYHDALAEAAWVAGADGDAPLAAAVREQLAGWRAAWGGGGSPAWDPYPIAVRAMNWLRLLGWMPLPAASAAALHADQAAQLDVLRRSLEWHLDGNHLLRDAWALAVAPWCHAGAWAERVGAFGARLFWHTLLEQVGPDGVHEERSPMYHARVFRDALEVLTVHRALGLAVPAAAVARLAAMHDALGWLRHPGGALRLLNDSAGDHGVDLDRLTRASAELTGARVGAPGGVWWAPAAGLLAARDPSHGDALLVDLSAPAPPHQPGHAHAGALGFELDIDGEPLVTDFGCSGYDADPWRAYLRGTAAHSTVSIGGRDQSEMWATFRIARRAVVEVERVRGPDGGIDALARCRPYHRPSAVHERRLRRDGRVLVVDDRVEGAGADAVEGYVHFHPDWEAERAGDRAVLLRRGSRRAVVRVDGPVSCTLHRGERSPVRGWRALGFGHVVPSVTLRLAVPRPADAAWRLTIGPE
jgi:uncharacterized heparinase superfamily protein